MDIEKAREILHEKREMGEWTLNDYNAAMRFLDEIYEEGYVILNVEIEGMKISVSTDYVKLKASKVRKWNKQIDLMRVKLKNMKHGIF